MRNLYIILSIILLTAVSCSRHRVIPKKKLAKIYYEMYMTDEAISQDRQLRRMTDSLHLYEPIFNKYGYSTDDYLYSVDRYLENPAKYKKIFEQTKVMMMEKKKTLEEIYTYETRFDRLRRWKTLDSLDMIVEAEGPGKSFFKAARFFFGQIDPKPVADTGTFSLTVERPDLDPLIIKAGISADSIRIDSLFRAMYYIDTAAVADSLPTDSTLTRTSAFSVHIFYDPEADTDTVAMETALIYTSPISEFILRDSAFMENVIYNYEMHYTEAELMSLKREAEERARKEEAARKKEEDRIDKPTRKDGPSKTIVPKRKSGPSKTTQPKKKPKEEWNRHMITPYDFRHDSIMRNDPRFKDPAKRRELSDSLRRESFLKRKNLKDTEPVKNDSLKSKDQKTEKK